MNILLQRIRTKAELLAKAYQTNQDAYLAHCLAVKQHEAQPSEQSNRDIVKTEVVWESCRDTIITLARGLLDATNALLSQADPHDFKALRKGADTLQEAITKENEAFHIYSIASGGDRDKRLAFEASQVAIVSQAWPLTEVILAMDSGYELKMTGHHAAWYFEEQDCMTANAAAQRLSTESAIETDLDGIPAWRLAETPEERDRILYENRKATLGAKAAGRMTYAEPRARAKRRNNWIN